MYTFTITYQNPKTKPVTIFSENEALIHKLSCIYSKYLSGWDLDFPVRGVKMLQAGPSSVKLNKSKLITSLEDIQLKLQWEFDITTEKIVVSKLELVIDEVQDYPWILRKLTKTGKYTIYQYVDMDVDTTPVNIHKADKLLKALAENHTKFASNKGNSDKINELLQEIHINLSSDPIVEPFTDEYYSE